MIICENFVYEEAPVGRRKEFEPRKGFAKGFSEGDRVMNGKVSHCPADGCEGLSALGVPVGAGEPEVRLVAATEQNVSFLDVSGYVAIA